MNRIFNFNQKVSIRIPIILFIIFLSTVSLLILESAGSYQTNIFGFVFSRVQKQILWLILGSLIFILVQFIRLRFFHEKMFLLYSLFLFIILLPFMSEATKGAQNWFMGFQPSEFGKIVIVISLAKILSDNKKNLNNIFFLGFCLLIIFVPLIIFIFQKDLGAVLVYSSILVPMFYWAGVKFNLLVFLIAPIFTSYTILYVSIYNFNLDQNGYSVILLSSYFIINFIYMYMFIFKNKFSRHYKFIYITFYIIFNLLSSYATSYAWEYLNQNDSNRSKDLVGRIENFIIPSLNEYSGGWHIKQSMVAVGSGGIFGKGVGEGSQVNLRFLPEADTDFVIASIAEALGFVFIFLIILICYNLFYWLIFYAQQSPNMFKSLLIIGFSSILFSHIIITMGMAVALAPITGIPAPFLSYGGTFTLTCFLMLGICNNVSFNK
tara:strand:- start:27952 stop:29256 length:1305 start_codon:yes stop_codon:yes gene_type:complete